MTTYPSPDEDPARPPAPETPGAAPTGEWGVFPTTSPQMTPSGRSGTSPGLVLWAGLAVLIALIIVLVVLAV